MKDSNNFIEDVDLSSADPKTLLIRDRVISRLGTFWAQPDKVLTAQQVAEAIKEAILSENPNFRYQTNKHYCPDEIEAKLELGISPLILSLNGFAPSNVSEQR